jgi:hypothetical protein
MARSPPHKQSNNHLLSELSKADFMLLDAHLSPVRLHVRRLLEDANKPIRHVYFPDTDIVSVVAEGTRARQSEVGLIRREENSLLAN